MPTTLHNLALIGYRGTGKTTVARLLAGALGWAVVDADDELQRRAGKSITAIFRESGESAFRDLESQVLGDLVVQPRAVLALGGGVVIRPENRQRLAACGLVIWLTAAPATIARRVAADAATAGQRPNLTTQGGPAEIVALLAKREPWYRACAGLVVDTEGRTCQQVADEILAHLATSPLDGDAS